VKNFIVLLISSIKSKYSNISSQIASSWQKMCTISNLALELNAHHVTKTKIKITFIMSNLKKKSMKIATIYLYTRPQLCTFIAPKEQHLLITISTARASEISAARCIYCISHSPPPLEWNCIICSSGGGRTYVHSERAQLVFVRLLIVQYSRYHY